jgi:hypothetical protein
MTTYARLGSVAPDYLRDLGSLLSDLDNRGEGKQAETKSDFDISGAGISLLRGSNDELAMV